MMTTMGFKRHAVDGGAAYYTFNMFFGDNSVDTAPATAVEQQSSQTPILFAHGVGIGILPYVHMLARMAASGHPIIAFEFNHLAMRVRAGTAETAVVSKYLFHIFLLNGTPSCCYQYQLMLCWLLLACSGRITCLMQMRWWPPCMQSWRHTTFHLSVQWATRMELSSGGCATSLNLAV
jgi:hypothetical protein